MFRATLKSLAAHKLRLALTAIAIVLGVAFMAGTFVLTDTIKHTFDTLFAQSASGQDIVVRGVAPYGTSGHDFASGERPPTPAGLVATIRALPGVRNAEGLIMGQVTVIKQNGKALKKNAPVFGTTYSADPLDPFKIDAGRAPRAPNELLMDVGTARDQHFALGDTVTVITNVGPGRFTLVGTEKFGKNASLAGATVVSFENATAQRLVGKPGFFDQIDVADKPGVALDTELAAVGAVLPRGVEAVPASVAAAQQAKSVERFIGYVHTFLLVFALIALFVGAFLIANTFSILIGQRIRELALFRAVGASRRQVIASLMGEALATGIVGSVLGLILGVPLAIGIYNLLKSAGLGVPSTTMQLLPRTIYVSLTMGIVITVLSAVGPAVRGSRIPPVAAMRDDATIAETSLRRRAIVGGALGGVGVIALALGLFGSSGIALVGVGAALTFTGVAVLAPFVAGAMARAIGRPLPAVAGVTGRLGKENAARNPRRTAGTASALMVGLGLVTAIATLGSSLTASFNAALNRDVTADYVISGGSNFRGFSPSAQAPLRTAPGVVAMSPYTEIDFHDHGASHRAAAIDPVAGPQVFNLHVLTGSATALARGQLLVDDGAARSRHLKVGDVLQLGFAATGIKPVAIGGTYKGNEFLDNYLLPYKLATDNMAQPLDELLFVKTTTRDAAEKAALANAISSHADLNVKTAKEFQKSQGKQFATFLAVAYVLLALSILIASFSVVNTMALSVIERTKEIGLLRAIGMGRKQVRAMIRGEAVVVALLGAVLGLVLGVGLGAAIVTAIGQTGFVTTKVVIPYSTVIVVLILAAIIGVVAAVFPARRAAKLDVLEAIATA
ncbi:MAG: ABC transporter permease [Acidimicrobiales bacterium]